MLMLNKKVKPTEKRPAWMVTLIYRLASLRSSPSMPEAVQRRFTDQVQGVNLSPSGRPQRTIKPNHNYYSNIYSLMKLWGK